MKASMPASGPLSPTRTQRTDLSSTQSMPLGTAVYDANVHQRAVRAAAALIDTFPEMEEHEERLAAVIERALAEQDRASRADELLRRFSPSVQHYVRRHTPSRD